MRTIYFIAMCLWLNACAHSTLLPPDSTENITADTSIVPSWKERTNYNSGAHFVSTKVQLGGKITQVLPKPGGVIILAEEQPADRYIAYGLINDTREGVFKFAIVFAGFPDDDMLRVGNKLAVVGEMDGTRQELIGSIPTAALPHLLAQCLHIWKTEGAEADSFNYENSVKSSQYERRTFCRKQDNGRNLSTGDDRRFHVPNSTGS